MGALVWRLTFGWLVAGGGAAPGVAPWPPLGGRRRGARPVALRGRGVGPARWGLPAVGARWPRGARWCGPGLGLAGGCWRRLRPIRRVLAAAAGGAARRRLARAAGGAARREPVAGGPGAGRGCPPVARRGVVLAGLWPFYGGVVRRALKNRSPAAGPDGGRAPVIGHRFLPAGRGLSPSSSGRCPPSASPRRRSERTTGR